MEGIRFFLYADIKNQFNFVAAIQKTTTAQVWENIKTSQGK